MSFYSTDKYLNRKDHRKPGPVDSSCAPHGGCSWCEGNRLHSDRKREEAAESSREDEQEQ